VCWVTIFLNWLEAVFTYKLPTHVIIGVRFVTRSITFKICGIHLPHYEGNA
jgi:hypothetical protein